MSPSDSVIELSSVTKIFGGDTQVVALEGVSLVVRSGEFVAIEGPSGSGKSTLLNVIALLDTPTAGSYRVLGRVVDEGRRRDLPRLRSRNFGFIFQSFHLMLRRSARENVELGLIYRGVAPRYRKELADEALQKVGLADKSDTSCAKLSGGERQRVAIARAMVSKPPILVADEPTGSLDTWNGGLVVEQLKEFHELGTTVVMVTHDPDVAAKADRRIALRDGRVVDDRPTAQRPEPAMPLVAAEGTNSQDEALGRPSTIRLFDMLAESWKALTSRPGRFAILTAAVGLAVALVVITLGLSETASAQVADTFDARLNREVTADIPKPADGALTPTAAERLTRQVAGVERAGAAQPLSSLSIAAPNADAPVDADGYSTSQGLVDATGAKVRWAPGHKARLGSRELLVGRLLAQDMQLGPLELDPQVSVNGSVFGVAGVIEDGGRLPELIDAVLISDRDQQIVGPPGALKLVVTTRQGAAQQVARQVPVAVQPANPDAVTVSAPVDPSSLQRDVKGDVKFVLLALSLVALLASILGVANSMLLGVIERIGELGLRRAMGARSRHILGQSAFESLLVGILGGLGGLFVGLIGILGITVFQHWAPVIDLRIAPIGVLGGALVGAVGGLPASVRASRINPADALRR